MFKILTKELLAPNIYRMDIEAPRVAQSAKPGQFIILRIDERGERIPLTIADYDIAKGSVTIVIQTVGYSTSKLCAMSPGDMIVDFAGPLGRPSEFTYESSKSLGGKRILFVAGGVGTAPVYPQVKWLSEHGVRADVIVGAKSENALILIDEMESVAGNVYITTDDGSAGYKGLVTDLLCDLMDNQGKHYDEVIAIGPMIMMKFVVQTTLKYGIKTIVSLNALMVDGTGMCGACRVTVGGKMRFTCVEGPEFDGHQVDFDEAMRRQGMYRTIESRKAHMAAERARGHVCNIGLDR